MEKLDQIQFTPMEEKSKSCCLNFLLECLKPKKDKDKKYYIEKWRIYRTPSVSVSGGIRCLRTPQPGIRGSA